MLEEGDRKSGTELTFAWKEKTLCNVTDPVIVMLARYVQGGVGWASRWGLVCSPEQNRKVGECGSWHIHSVAMLDFIEQREAKQ